MGIGVRAFALDHDDELSKILDATGDARDLLLVVRIAVPRGNAVCDLSGKFGADPDQAARLLRSIERLGNRAGLTFHVGSQCLEPDAYGQAILSAGRTLGQAGVEVDVLDIGGGFPAAYVGTEPPPLDLYLSTIREAVSAIGLPPSCRLQCEPGRALVAEGCSIVTRVELRRDQSLFLNDGVFGGLSELRFDGLTLPMRVIRPDGVAADEVGPFSLFGPTCDAEDAAPGPFWLPADVRAGDWLEIGQLGAYSCVLRTGFNGFGSDVWAVVRDDPLMPTAAMRPDSEVPCQAETRRSAA